MTSGLPAEAGVQAPLTLPHRALLIGINAYSGKRLKGAVGDATTLRDALVRYGFQSENVRVLTDGAATRAAVVSAIADLAQQTPPEGRAVFAFAGHTRKVRGENVLVAADGGLISASELAAALGRVRAPMWLAFPTCYAAGFRIPGIVGPQRVVTFAAGADELAYEATAFGRSFLFQYMVHLGMVLEQSRAPTVESAFEYARSSLQRDYPNRVPLMDDQFEGDFGLAGPAWRPAPRSAASPAPRSVQRAPRPVPASPSPRPMASRPPPSEERRNRQSICVDTAVLQYTGC